VVSKGVMDWANGEFWILGGGLKTMVNVGFWIFDF
jgi:hypothetical protein